MLGYCIDAMEKWHNVPAWLMQTTDKFIIILGIYVPCYY